MLDGLRALDILFGGLGVLLLFILFSQKRRDKLPPGPSGFPLVGNVLDMPTSKEWLTFARWGERWGSCILSRYLFIGLLMVRTQERSSLLTYSDSPWSS